MNARQTRKAAEPPNSLTSPGDAVTIRHCQGIKEFEDCIRVERETWKSSDIDVVPLPLFVVASETGGQVLGAFCGSELVGFTLAIAGWRGTKPFLHSHMTAVLDAYQNHHIGRRLKLFQRKEALASGIRLVEWTFDPLVTRNAYFNLARLGAVARRYLPNAYGITTSPLHGPLPTDRLVAEWHLASPRVRRIVAGRHSKISSRAARIEIPSDADELRHTDPAEALKVLSRVRIEFADWFERGYAATAVQPRKGGIAYILEPWSKLEGRATHSA
jgi:predicted GNAT superfamily acetyltransferase